MSDTADNEAVHMQDDKESFSASYRIMPGFFKFSLANCLQLLMMLALLLNWWGGRESANAAVASTQAVLITTVSERVTKLEESSKQVAVNLQDVQNKVNVLVAVAEEQRKKQR